MEQQIISTELGERVKLRALGNDGDLWLIPQELEKEDSFLLSDSRRFVRHREREYNFGPWKRRDGTPCDEEPGQIYALGTVLDLAKQ